MPYIPPNQVVSPKRMLANLQVIYNGGEGGWSLAKMSWDGESAIGIRWNGDSPDTAPPSKGNPQSSGHPTWFILPKEIAWMVAAFVQELSTPTGQNNQSII